MLVSLLLFLGFWSFIDDNKETEAVAERNQRQIEQQFRDIPPLSRALVIQQNATHRTERGIISTAYKTESSYQTIKLHYDHQLSTRGWELRREAGVTFDGTDYGGMDLVYCKKDYVAELQYAGRQEREFGWTFSFAVIWGNSDECK